MTVNKEIAFVLCFITLCAILQPSTEDEPAFYKFVLKDISGKDVDFAQYKGKVLLLVNVASECGYTDGHYRELVQIQDEFSSHGFTVLAFPCNQFGQQEPNDDKGILKFAQDRYNVNFPLFSKIDVGGEHAHPLYVYLYQVTADYPKWNFGKYLVDRNGKAVKFFSQRITAREVAPYIELLINNKTIDSYHTDL
ncbi:probable phospholipid hydroperoxide glutathione peroxidase [Dendronephthya gigantea]|uniref:probable phospholipid hydroperoxide glutathione peroxidase n=1 Tax=Dendronephthya gigantea TaxID=151771 RepID=UPI00106A0D26|nr:probable phospholipid hydroperoxide glutathione peroxidase [Dendronephthya gigantea]XP_028405357.1 probable phospholipid hydroperoxide glutathione peroxidase [Dendronephthya gigantea]